MIREQRYNLFGYRFSFRTNYPRAAELFSELYIGRIDDSGLEPHNSYELLHDPDAEPGAQWIIAVPGPPPHTKPTFGDAISGVEAAITADMARHPVGLHLVHGGIVYSAHGDLLLSGYSEAGKTTLTLALAARGLRVGGDDMALLDPATGELLPHPRCFHIDDKSAALLAGRRVSASGASPSGSIRYARISRDGLASPRALGLRLFIGAGAAEPAPDRARNPGRGGFPAPDADRQGHVQQPGRGASHRRHGEFGTLLPAVVGNTARHRGSSTNSCKIYELISRIL